MTTEKTRTPRDTNKPLTVADAAERIVTCIDAAPDEAEIESRVRQQAAKERAELQGKIDAFAARVPVPERSRLPKVVVALLDGRDPGGLVLFGPGDLGPATSDSAPSSDADELPPGARPLPPERLAIGDGRRR